MATWLDGYLNGIISEMSNIETKVKSLLLEREDEIRDLIRDRWKNEGINKPYSKTSKYYVSGDELYYIFKNNLNPNPGLGNVDLILTGALVESIELILNRNRVEVIATNWKYDTITEQYGKQPFNITETQEDRILSEIATDIINDMMKKIWN